MSEMPNRRNFAERHWKQAAAAVALGSAIFAGFKAYEAQDQTMEGVYSQVEDTHTNRVGNQTHYYLTLEQCPGSTPEHPLFDPVVGQIDEAAGCRKVDWDVDTLTYLKHQPGDRLTR
jgi:hypothetical protein